MENIYYIHINTNALPHYLVDGIIRPANLIKNRENDFQNNSGNHIILSLKKWNKISDCSIELVLNSGEDKELEQMSTDFFLCHTALPISRIKAIYFEDKEKAETIIWNINRTVAFVPNWAIKYTDKEKDEIAEEYPFTHNSKKDQTKELTIALKRFDRLLGGLAFLKVSAGINYNNKINFSESYFSTLAYFNKRIASDIKNNNIAINDRFHEIFKGDSRIFNYLAKQIDQPLIEEVSKQEGIQLKSKFGVIDLTNLPTSSLTFKLAILESFGKESSKSVEDLINSLLSNLNEDISEEIALIYGLYVGYNALRNYYKIDDKEIQVKFDLTSKIDFYTIESIYQYTFHNKSISSDFDYLSLKFLSTQSAPIKDPKYKYVRILNNYYAYKITDYSVQKTNIIETLIKEVSRWFPSDLFKTDNDKLSDKLNTLINPKLNSLIEEVRTDIDKVYAINEEIINSTSKNKEPKQEPVKEKHEKVNPAKEPIREKTNRKQEDKERVTDELDLFNNANKVNDKTEEESNLNLSTSPNKKVYNASELEENFTIPQLKELANDLKIKIKGITKKGDIIKIILSNQD